ncbi:MAG: CcmD family protein [bacterium]|nr:CcmD family protein [bacterium]
MNKKFLSVLFTMMAIWATAQPMASDAPQMADAFRENGKIYVVITVISLIFLAIIAFLVYLERTLKKLENMIKDKS